MNRLFIKRMLSIICTIAIFVGGLYCFHILLVNKTSRQKYEEFFNSDKEFDVLFLGSSHVINGISPLDLFRDYGITSYNLSMHGNDIISNYYLLAEVLEILERKDRRLPQIVALDVYIVEVNVENLHNAWDNFPVSKNKIEMMKELLPGEERISMLFPFFLYHNRWNEITRNDFEPELNKWYGAELRYGLSYPDNEIIRNAKEKEKVDEKTVEYLNKINELCEAHGIRLILINIPYSCRPDLQRKANGIYDYSKEKGIWYENYMNRDFGIDFDIDFFDHGHLNSAGMRKMTKELGRALVELGMEDYRGTSLAKQWQEEYEDFIDYRIERLKGLKGAKTYLMSLHDPDLISLVRIKSSMLKDRQIAELVECLKKEGHKISVEEGQLEVTFPDGSVTQYDIYCQVYKKKEPEVEIHRAGFVYGESYDKK